MNRDLEDKVAIVTGASRGIGRAIATELGARKARLVLVARACDLLNEVAASIGRECLVYPADLRSPEAAAEVVAATIQRFKRLDILVNNAGATQRGDFLALGDADWNDGFALKFFGAMRLCRAAWPYLVASQGSIVNIVGVGGKTASAEFAIGGSVNSALLNLTKALADRGVADGVRVNAVNPGAIATDRLRRRIESLAASQGQDHTTAAKTMAAGLGIARFGEPLEIARVVAFLASAAASYCQGAILDVDGGETRAL
jgi:3-oxoacyl-[acyl-carrier protein] reductase